MKFLRSLMEAGKPESGKITAGDHREYQRQLKTTFKGNAKFKEGKIGRGEFANAAMDILDNCPKNGHCDESTKSQCVSAMWKSYKDKHTAAKPVAEGKNHLGDREYQSYKSWKAAIKKAYPNATFRGDIDIGGAQIDGKDVGEWGGDVGSVYASKLKEAEDKEYSSYSSWKAAIKKAHPSATFRGDKDIGAGVVDGKDVGEWDGDCGCVYSHMLKEAGTDPKDMCKFKVTLFAGEEEVTYKVTDTDKEAAAKQALAKLRISNHKEKKGKVKSVIEEGWDDSEEDKDVKAANDEVKKRGIKMLSPRAEKALQKRADKQDKKDESRAVALTKKAVSKEDVNESVITPSEEPGKEGLFSTFLKQK